jgi:hypothetical protein
MNRSVKFRDLDRSMLKQKNETVEFTLYSYEPNSNPAGSSDQLLRKTMYNGSFKDAPIELFNNDQGSLVVDEMDLANELFEEYGEGVYSVYKFGGNPPKESYFENKVIAENGKKLNVNDRV